VNSDEPTVIGSVHGNRSAGFVAVLLAPRIQCENDRAKLRIAPLNDSVVIGPKSASIQSPRDLADPTEVKVVEDAGINFRPVVDGHCRPPPSACAAL
jgi:hypothetical protein